ncbi:MAG TPA: acylneuraminate cytidylyltransferase [Epsilonproteobacteria bacterium]|nr:acylneuraminate cytidylyltransferase [Campylobacterota bacterium]
MNTLIVIPARGGSKGIPRKNLRSLAGKPLIAYSIETALASRYAPDVYVSSEDEEILSIASQLGAKIVKRDSAIADDDTTLDPVIFDAFKQVENLENKKYDLIITLQPTSPLLETTSLDEAISRVAEDDTLDTVIAAHDDTHLTWRKDCDGYTPNYKERLNRQYLTPVFKETGGFLITRSRFATVDNRIGNNVDLYLLEGGENIDIDTYEDWSLCEYYLKRKKILFVVSGYSEIGLGHVYNTLLIANDILNHNVEFLVDKKSDMAYEKIKSNHYRVHKQQNENIVDDIKVLNPNLVINDRLNTEVEYMKALKDLGLKIINFEDNGEAISYADIVINAIYPEENKQKNHYFGSRYFLLRDEFLLSKPRELSENIKNILITFGGIDSNNYTKKVIESVYDYCQQSNISISVVAGFGYQHYDSLKGFKNINVYINAKNIVEHMRNADIIFTSAGRTTYEIASLQVPTIVMAQNERELTHCYAREQYGFTNLGLGYTIGHEDILDTFIKMTKDLQSRKIQRVLMSKMDLRSGRKRTQKLINEIMEQA